MRIKTRIYENLSQLDTENQVSECSLPSVVHATKAEMGDRSTFDSNLGLVFSCLGSAVGTRNIWRFPRILATNSSSKG
ncbi:hypothetical protein FGIG_10562 [Fasciola gigantica]|uniref:Uncharacterized protein n=1 Tax=Fasciola gigantica TaxID=46835 RepID=A0A504YNU0_FASGI|nr:hypothetical protein FGIG_10562 [Fasciola gigantica]